MAKTTTRIPSKPHFKGGQDREPVARVPFGLGADPSPGAAARCLSCGFGNVPVVRQNFSLVTIGIVAVSLLPVVFEYLAARRRTP